jgi:hypothetical protein
MHHHQRYDQPHPGARVRHSQPVDVLDWTIWLQEDIGVYDYECGCLTPPSLALRTQVLLCLPERPLPIFQLRVNHRGQPMRLRRDGAQGPIASGVHQVSHDVGFSDVAKHPFSVLCPGDVALVHVATASVARFIGKITEDVTSALAVSVSAEKQVRHALKPRIQHRQAARSGVGENRASLPPTVSRMVAVTWRAR